MIVEELNKLSIEELLNMPYRYIIDGGKIVGAIKDEEENIR